MQHLRDTRTMRCSAESESLSIMADEQKVRYLPTFYYDLFSTVTYIKDVLMNPIAARQLVNDVESTILETSKNPGIFEPYRAERKLEKTYYRLIYKQKLINSPFTCYHNRINLISTIYLISIIT